MSAFVCPPGFVTVPEAAQLLGLKPRTLHVYRCKGRGPHSQKIGVRVVYPEHAVIEYLNWQQSRKKRTAEARQQREADAVAKRMKLAA